MISDEILSVIDFLITCLEMFFVLYLLQNEKKKRGCRWIVFAAVFVIAVVCMTYLEVSLILKLVIQVIIIICLGKYVYRCSIFKLTVYGLCHAISIYVSELIIVQSWNIFLEDPLVSNNIIFKEFMLSAVLAIKALHFLIVLIIQRVMKKDKFDRKFKEIIPTILRSLPFILVLDSISLNLPYIKNERYIIIFICCSIVILFSFIANIIFDGHYLTVRKKAQEEEMMVYELQIKYAYYQKRMEDEERVKSIYHDLKNHFLLADNSIDNDIKKKLQRYENYYDMGNEFVNIIISEKSHLARENNIRFECEGNFGANQFMEPLDISTILGNILDNSIEACMKVDESNRFIFLTVAQKGDLLIIVVKNTVSNVIIHEESLKTIKKNKSFHGYGLPNVKKAIKKYNGDCSVSVRNGEFVISIVIPIPDTERIFR